MGRPIAAKGLDAVAIDDAYQEKTSTSRSKCADFTAFVISRSIVVGC